MALTQQQLRMMAALLAKKQQPSNALYREPPRGLLNALNKPLPMEGRFGLLPIKESQPGMGPSVFNKRELALPGLLAGAVNAFTAPGRAASGQPGFKPEEEAANFAGNFMGGGLLGSKMAPPPRGSVGMNAFHGSPHKFDAFDMSKLGTGEGAQMYGHGLYFAESPSVAKSYIPRDLDVEEKLLKRYKVAESRNDYESMEIWENAMLHETPSEIRARYASSDYDASMRSKANKIADEMERFGGKGHLYHVDIPDEAVGKMMDWDKPLAQQPANVKAALAKLAAGDDPDLQALFADGVDWEHLGLLSDRTPAGGIYKTLATKYGSEAALSRKLNELGVTGIRYLDQGSRDAGEGTRNFVLFDDKLVKVKKRE
jgi:hypothetical protein